MSVGTLVVAHRGEWSVISEDYAAGMAPLRDEAWKIATGWCGRKPTGATFISSVGHVRSRSLPTSVHVFEMREESGESSEQPVRRIVTIDASTYDSFLWSPYVARSAGIFDASGEDLIRRLSRGGETSQRYQVSPAGLFEWQRANSLVRRFRQNKMLAVEHGDSRVVALLHEIAVALLTIDERRLALLCSYCFHAPNADTGPQFVFGHRLQVSLGLDAATAAEAEMQVSPDQPDLKNFNLRLRELESTVESLVKPRPSGPPWYLHATLLAAVAAVAIGLIGWMFPTSPTSQGGALEPSNGKLGVATGGRSSSLSGGPATDGSASAKAGVPVAQAEFGVVQAVNFEGQRIATVWSGVSGVEVHFAQGAWSANQASDGWKVDRGAGQLFRIARTINKEASGATESGVTFTVRFLEPAMRAFVEVVLACRRSTRGEVCAVERFTAGRVKH